MDVGNVAAGAEIWEKVSASCGPGRCRPPASRAGQASLRRVRDIWRRRSTVPRPRSPNPGRPAVHRLNRAEYANAIRDCLAVGDRRRALLPADDSGYGFDNIGDVLTVSPLLLERYMAAARRISRLAVGDRATARPRRPTSPQILHAGRPHERGPAIRLARRHRDPPSLPRSTASTSSGPPAEDKDG